MSADDRGPAAAGGDSDASLDATGAERRELEERMSQIRQEVLADVEANWPAMWRSPDLVDAKVDARLSGHEGYQRLLRRVREMDSREAGQGDQGGAEDASGA